MTGHIADAWKRKAAVVTGAGRGIGRAIAVELARNGFALCMAARTRAELEATRELCGLAPARSLIVLLDLADPESPSALMETAIAHFGGIDLLVNNAGWAPSRTAVVKTGLEQIERIVAVNLLAPMLLTRLALAEMTKHARGTIINIASLAARATPAGEAAYSAAKAGLVAFTHACFAEVRENGIRIAVILPGLADTALIPGNRRLSRELMLRPADVAHAVMQVVGSPPGVCPLEIVLQPQRNPERAR